MQPYINPNYFYQMPAPATIRGKYINVLEDITPNDVPMDGTKGVFVKTDLSEIYVRGWKSDGSMTTDKYVKVIEEHIDPLSNIEKRLDVLEEKINGLNANLTNGTKKPNVKPSTSNGPKE